MSYDVETHCTENFSWAEMDPRNLAGPIARKNLHLLCNNVLEPLRKHFGGKPVHISSGYRDITVQARLWEDAVRKYGSVDAAREHVAPPGHSQHEVGCAADHYIDGVSIQDIADFHAANPCVGGIGLYPADGFVHVDIRPRAGGPIARW